MAGEWAGRGKPTTTSRWVRTILGAAAALLAVTGVVLDLGLALGLTVAFVLVAAVIGGLGGEQLRNRDAAGSRRHLIRLLAAAAGAGPVVAGLAVVFGAAATPIVLVLIGLAVARRLFRGPAGRSATGSVSVCLDPGDDLTALSDAELAQVWHQSHALLARTTGRAELERVCALRRRLLDEIERRDPAGFRRWFAGGGWIRADSVPFLRG
jgi:hypothetical protein